MKRTVACVGSVLMCIGLAGSTGAQPSTAKATDESRAALSRLIAQSLEETRVREAKLERAAKQLEAGASPEAIRRLLLDALPAASNPAPPPRNAVRSKTFRRACDELTVDEQRILNAVLDKAVPDLRNQMEQICTNDAQQCNAQYLNLRDRLGHIIDEGLSDEGLFKIRLQEIETSRQAYYKAIEVVERQRESSSHSDEEAAELQGALSELIATQYDLRLAAKQYGMIHLLKSRDNLDTQIEQLQEQIDQITSSRDDVINRQVDLAIERARAVQTTSRNN